MSASPVEFDAVRIEELLEEVARRRQRAGLPCPEVELEYYRECFRKIQDPRTRGSEKEVAEGLRALQELLRKTPLGETAGLAFSGGGARSACVSLGFLQGLAQPWPRPKKETPEVQPFNFDASLLRQFDYLSTVSGGGYTGSLLSALATHRWEESRTKASEVLESLDPVGPREGSAAVQPLAERMASRGLLIGKIGLFLSRHLASTLLFDLMLVSGLLLVAGSVALLWRLLDTPPFIEFIWWVSDREVREYNRPFLIPLCLFIPWILVALSRPDSNLGMRILGVGLIIVVFAMWMGATFLYATALSLSFVCLPLAVNSTGPYRMLARAWAGFALATLLTVLVLVLSLTVAHTFGWFVLISGVFCLVQLVVVSALALELEKSRHRRAAAGLLYVASASLIISAAIWLATPNMNYSAQSQIDSLQSQQWINYVLAIVSALVLPFLRPKELIKSGLPSASPTKRWIFNFASAGMLVGVPFLVVYYLGQHNISGYADNPGRAWSRWDVRQERHPEFCRLLFDEWNRNDFWGLNSPTPASELMRLLDQKVANERAENENAAKEVLAKGKASARMKPGEPPWADVDEWIYDMAKGRRPVSYQKLSPLFPVPQLPLDVYRKGVDEETHFAQAMTLLAKDPQYINKLTTDKGFRELLHKRMSDQAEHDAKHPSALAAARKKNREQLNKLLQARDAPSGWHLDPVDELSPEEKAVGEDDAQLGNLLCFVYHTDYLVPLGFVRRPVVIVADQQWRALFLGIILIVFVLCAFLVDINWTSAQSYYERQLELAYLRLEDAEPRSVALHKVANTDFGLPYHILTGAVDYCDYNEEPESQLRGFLFSKLYCGARGIRYHPSESYLKRKVSGEDDGLQLAHAMSISGAAVSLLRLEGNWLLRVVLAVVNFRLGQWLPKPGAKNRQPHVSLFTLVGSFFANWLPPWRRRETGSERCQVVFVADGGFYENLGIEPLIQRRCRFIVALDAGADPDSTFADFDQLHRRLRRVGVQLSLLEGLTSRAADDAEAARRGKGQMRVDAVIPYQLAPEPAGIGDPTPSPDDEPVKKDQDADPAVFAPSHFVFAKLKYPDQDEPGILVYVKSTMTGDEDVDLKMYHRTHRPFPHHPTSEQLLDAQMVDAYRQLGLHMAQRLCTSLPAPDGPVSIGAFVERLLTLNDESKPARVQADGEALEFMKKWIGTMERLAEEQQDDVVKRTFGDLLDRANLLRNQLRPKRRSRTRGETR